VIAESGIDALSYAVLHANENARYASTAGALNPNQPTLIVGAIAKMVKGASIRVATDNDEGGRQIAEQIADIAAESSRTDLSIVYARHGHELMGCKSPVGVPECPSGQL